MRLAREKPEFAFHSLFLACSTCQGSLVACPSAVPGRALAFSPDSAINWLCDFGQQPPNLCDNREFRVSDLPEYQGVLGKK